MNKPTLSNLRIYPVKSLGPVEVQSAEVRKFALKNDRFYAMIDEDGRYLNAKRSARVNKLKSDFDLNKGLIILTDRATEKTNTFELKEGNTELDNYLTNFFGLPLKLKKNLEGDFMDIPKISGLTVISEASMRALQPDLGDHSLESLRLRFRSNIELSGVDAYWEEQLYQEPGIGIRFKIGEVEMLGISPRARCNVPPQDPESGATDPNFVKNMINSRNQHLATAGKVLEFGRSTYFLAINVMVRESEIGKTLNVGDSLEILGAVKLKVGERGPY